MPEVLAAGETNTAPFCGSCGWKISAEFPNRDSDAYCDACGADLRRFGFEAYVPPSDLAADSSTPGHVAFTWTPGLGGTAFRYQITGFDWITIAYATSPWLILGFVNDVVVAKVASTKDGVAGPWSDTVSGTIT